MKKRLLSFFLALVIFTTSVPLSALATENTSQNIVTQTNSTTNNGIDYKMNGGSFADGYQAPTTYPANVLPKEENIRKDGYEFGGWYDNEAFEGEKVTSIEQDDYSKNVVLYAKWIERYYYVDIPQTAPADNTEISITAQAGGFYEDDYVGVTVHSANDWKLKNGEYELEYELRDVASGVKMENDALVTTLTKDEKHQEETLTCSVIGTPQYTGNYTDTLTFDVSFRETRYSIHFETNGGKVTTQEEEALIQDTQYPAGTFLSKLPTAIRENSTFIGWCYDEACTKYVDSEDRLLDNITLYASYTDNQPLETTTIATYARGVDEATDFIIRVTDFSESFTAVDVKSYFTISNVSDSSEEPVLTVTEGEGHTFTISNQAGWKPGSSYRLELKNDSLYFTGFDKTIREYDFSIYKDEVENVQLNQQMKYISINELQNLTVNGNATNSVSVATMTVGTNGSITSEGSDTSGTFTYTKQVLKVGDQIAVYSGNVIPDMSVSSGDNGEVSFFEITKAEGNEYSYQGSKAEDVLFMPDVLPFFMDNDLDGQADNGSVTVARSYMTFGNDAMSQALNLNADTTVDVGDFLAFYTDIDGEILSYGKISSVNIVGENYIITYTETTLDEVYDAMDVYRKENVEGEALIENTDVEQLEADIELQALESGFTDEVVNRIAVLTMETESFEELQSSLLEEMNAELTVQSGDISMFRAAKAGQLPSHTPRVEVGLDHVKANLGTTLTHFEGDVSGLRLALDIGVMITIHVNAQSAINILVTATFEQEVRVSINVDGEAVWKKWGIFPYIADYRVTASLDLYEYTGIGLEVNFKTEKTNLIDKKSKLRNGVNKISEELKSMMEDGEEYIEDKMLISASFGETQEDDTISVAKSLAERYSELLEDESEWVEIYNRTLTEQHFRVLLIIDIEISLEFVVSANVNVSMGMSYWYQNAKRYVFCLKIKERVATSDTIDLCEEQYEFTAYAMGTIGLRAGVRLTVSVGLISTSIASVGLSAEVGGYAQIWGYMYYQLKYAASTGRETRSMGAMYFELGIYLEIKFKAQALSNAFTYMPTLYEHQWPLYTVGVTKNIMDFNYEEEDIQPIKMKRDVKSVRIPDKYFEMQYMDLKEGLDDGEYFTQVYEDNSQYFNIAMTNPAFSYDATDNIIRVTPGDKPEEDGEMIITWKCQEGAFDTTPPSRRIRLHWDELNDGYCMAFQSNGGTYIDSICGEYNEVITVPQDPVRQGYIFKGWYRDEECTIPYTIPSKIPNEDLLLFAKWEEADVDYTVINYLEGTNGVYEVETSVKKQDKTGKTVTCVPQDITGYITPAAYSQVIKADGSTVFEFYYAREEYQIIFKTEGEIISDGVFKYGSMMPTPAAYRPGYDFAGWTSATGGAVPETVPAQDTIYNANWRAASGVIYTVKYYIQNADNIGYTLSDIKTFTGTTGETVTAALAEYSPTVYHLKGTLPQGVVQADGSLVLSVYYDLNTYNITYDAAGGVLYDENQDQVSTITEIAKPGDSLILPVPERKGYVFEGWYKDEQYTEVFGGNMPYQDTTLYAKWEALKVNYTVRYLLEDLSDRDKESSADGDFTTYSVAEEKIFAEKPGVTVIPEVIEFEGFTSPEPKEVVVEGSGQQVIEYRYSRKTYTITYVDETEETLQHGQMLSFEPYRRGYAFKGWYLDEDFTKKYEENIAKKDLTLYGKWEACETPYEIRYWYQTLEGGMSLEETDTLYAMNETCVTPDAKEVKGFVTPDNKSLTLTGEYTDYIEYVYYRKKCSLTYVKNNGEVNETLELSYGADISLIPKKAGNAFAGWYKDAQFTNKFEGTMPDTDLTLYAKWEPNKVAYQVKHYVQSAAFEDSYDLAVTENLAGDEFAIVPVSVKTFTGFTAPSVQNAEMISGEDKIVVEYYYTRNQYPVILDYQDGTLPATKNLFYGTKVADAVREGYQFMGWYTDSACTQKFEETVPVVNENGLKLYAKWEASDMPYFVSHCLQNPNGDGYTLALKESFQAKTDTEVSPLVKEYTGYLTPSVQTKKVPGDDILQIEYLYLCKEHTLTLYNCGEEGREERSLRYGATIPAVSRAGYSFEGWFTDEQCRQKYEGTMPDENLTLYAKWEAQKTGYLVEHYQKNLNDDSETLVKREAKFAITDTVVSPDTENYTGFITPEKQTITVKGDDSSVVKYVYQRKQHTLKFMLDNGQEDIVTTKYYGDAIVSVKPEKTGYSFIGWDKNVLETMPDEDVTYKAKWVANAYTIRFSTGGGTAIPTITSEYGAKITKPENPSRKGYIFKGWLDANNQRTEIPSTMPAQNITFTADWEIETYHITYNLNGGQVSGNPTEYTVKDTSKALIAPKKAGYSFAGWSGTDIQGIKESYSLKAGATGDKSYTANWTENSYTIQFSQSGPGVKNKMASIKVKYTESKQLPENKFQCNGYNFAGWTTKSNGTKVEYANRSYVQKLSNVNQGIVTLYPIWTPKTYTVTLDYGYKTEKIKCAYNSYYSLPRNPTRYGWVFNGWKLNDPKGTITYDTDVSAAQLQNAKDIVLYADWTANKKYSYKPSDSSNKYYVTDSHELTQFTFYVDGNQTAQPTTKDIGVESRRYHLNMTNLSYQAVHSSYSKIKVTISFKIEKKDNGWADLRYYYREKGQKDMVKWEDDVGDLKDQNGHTLKFTHTLEKNNVDALMFEFDAHGHGKDRWWMSNMNIDIEYE